MVLRSSQKKHEPWFAKGQPGIQDVHQKLVQCMDDLTKPGLSEQQKSILRRRNMRPGEPTDNDQWNKRSLLQRNGNLSKLKEKMARREPRDAENGPSGKS